MKKARGSWLLTSTISSRRSPIEDLRYPSFSLSLLIEELINKRPAQGATVSLLREELLNWRGVLCTQNKSTC
jgi:hypothetical protein